MSFLEVIYTGQFLILPRWVPRKRDRKGFMYRNFPIPAVSQELLPHSGTKFTVNGRLPVESNGHHEI
jgi:hypothetical protein